jgi:hypothetical protein
MAKTNGQSAKQFCAGAIFKKINGSWYVVGVSVLSKNGRPVPYCGEVKFPGGTDENAPWENPHQTFLREFPEETWITPTKYHEVHHEGDEKHTRYFFLITDYTCKGDFFRVGEVRDKDEPDGQKIRLRLWEIHVFAEALFYKYNRAFAKAIAEMAMLDQAFCNDNMDILRRFPVEE